jgi:hypothetical protein
MKRYFFVVVGPDEPHDDEVGTPLADNSAALAYGRRIIRELKEAGGYDDPRLAMLVQNENRHTLFTIPFANETIGTNGDAPPESPVERD